MSFLFGHKKVNKPDYTGLPLQTSNSTIPIAIGFGKNRVAPNIIWQDDFKAHKQKQKGGKGLGGSGQVTYTYTASYLLSLGWGVASAVTNTWKDQGTESDYTKLGFTFFPGTVPQSPWGYLTTNHPTAALGYPGLVLMAVSNFDLGGSNVFPQFTFEVKWPLLNTAPGGVGDADPAQCVDTLLNSSLYGALGGFPMQLDNFLSTGAATTTGDSAYQTYCKAMGFGMSPLLDSQETCTTILDRWATMFNTALCWTGYSLSFQPYGADTITGNGVTYLPDNTLEFALTDDNGDFIYSEGEDPVRLIRKRQSSQPNCGNLEIRNRGNQYNTEPAPWDDQASIDLYGRIPADSYTAHEICEPSIGVVCAQLYGNRQAATPNQFEFTTGLGFMAMVPGSKGTTTDPEFGTLTVRVIDMEEADDGSFRVQVEEYYGSVSSVSPNTAETTTNNPVNTNVSALSVNTPIIFEPPSTLAGLTAQVWIAVSAGPAGVFDPNWGGANVYLSSDNVTYQEVGTIDTAARMGPLATALASYGGANPDTTHSFDVNLAESEGDLQSVTASDAASFATLSIIQDTPGSNSIEFLSYQDATLVSGNRYTLGTKLYRGLYGTAAGAHTTSALFARLDDNIFKFNLPSQYIGQTIYIKLQSFNIFGEALQDIATCTAYTYAPYGTGYGGGSGGVPTTPTGVSASPSSGFNTVSWVANPTSDNVVRYEVWRANGIGAAFGSASRIGSTTGTSYTDSTATAGSAYTYFVVAVNVVGSSSASSGANCTSSAAAAIPYGFSFGPKTPVVNKILGYFDSPLAWTLPASLPDCQGDIVDSDSATATGPTAQTDFDIQSPPGTSIGTMRFATSALTPTFIKASNTSIPLGQPVQIVAPANINGITGAIAGSLKGTR